MPLIDRLPPPFRRRSPPPIAAGDDQAGQCYAYGRHDVHGSRIFSSQKGAYSAVFAPSHAWREATDWEISLNVTSQHRCDGAECEYL